MATDPDLELQGLIVQRLKADPDVTALVNGRVFDSVPSGAAFPYVSYGPTSTEEDDADCIKGASIYVQLDVWSRDVGFPEAKRISSAVRECLHDVDDLTLTDNALVFLNHYQTQTMRDPDGLTSHAAVLFQAFIERP